MADTTVIIGNSPVKIHDNGDGTYSATSVINAPIPAGTNLMGKVGIDQTTPGVTNGVSIVGSLASDALAPGSGNIAQTPVLFNEASWDRQRGNTQGTLLASAARTASTFSANQINYNARGVLLNLNITAASGTGGLGVTIFSVDPISGMYTTLLTATASLIKTTGVYSYELYPGSSAAPGGAGQMQQLVSAALPRTWLISVTHGDGSSYTYSVGYALIV